MFQVSRNELIDAAATPAFPPNALSQQHSTKNV